MAFQLNKISIFQKEVSSASHMALQAVRPDTSIPESETYMRNQSYSLHNNHWSFTYSNNSNTDNGGQAMGEGLRHLGFSDFSFFSTLVMSFYICKQDPPLMNIHQ